MLKKIFLINLFLFVLFVQIGFCDKGVLLQNHKYNDVSISKGTKVDILNENSESFKIKYEKFEFLIDKTKVLKTSFKTKENGKTIEKPIFTVGYLNDNVLLTYKNQNYSLEKGTKVIVKDYKKDLFILVDKKGVEYNMPEKYLVFDLKKLESEYSFDEKIQKYQVALQKVAANKIGITYLKGGKSKVYGFDAPGLIQSIFADLKIKVPDTVIKQSNMGKDVKSLKDLQIGDLIFFDEDGGTKPIINHVGMYIGKNHMIHVTLGEGQVVMTDIRNNYLFPSYVIKIKRYLY